MPLLTPFVHCRRGGEEGSNQFTSGCYLASFPGRGVWPGNEASCYRHGLLRLIPDCSGITKLTDVEELGRSARLSGRDCFGVLAQGRGLSQALHTLTHPLQLLRGLGEVHTMQVQ